MVVMNAVGNWRFVYSANVNEFFVCEGWDQENNRPIGQKDTIYKNDRYLSLCGNLESDVPIQLSIYIYRAGYSRPILSNMLGDRFTPGYFIRMIETENKLDDGEYRSDIYLNRDLLATTEFKVASR